MFTDHGACMRHRVQTCVMRKHGHGHRLDRDIRDIAQATTTRHLHLRNRLVKILALTVIVVAIASTVMYITERDVANTELHNFGNTLYWTTAQLTTLSSSLPNPLTPMGKVVTIVLDLYALTVVSSLAGMFGAFFLKRSDDQSDDLPTTTPDT